MITSDQQQKMQVVLQQMKTAGTLPQTSSTPSSSNWYQGVKTGAFNGEADQQTNANDEGRNIIQKGLGVVFDPLAKFSTHVGEGVGLGIAEGASALTGDKKYAQRAEAAIGKDSTTPVLGTKVPGLTSPGQAVRQVGGEAAGSLALATGSPAAGGALLGLDQGLESGQGVGGVAVDTIAGALGGKVLEYGFGKIAPYISKGIEKYGMPLYDKLEQYIPENAKAALKAAAEKITPAPVGETGIEKVGSKVTGAVEGAFDKAGQLKDKALGNPAGDYEKSISAAQKKLNPYDTYTLEEKKQMTGAASKQKGSGPFKHDVPDQAQNVTPEHQAVAELHQSGELPDTNTPSQDVATIQQHAERHDQNIDEFLAEPKNNVPFTPKSVNKMFDGVVEQAQKDRVFLSDSSEEKAYRDVIDVAKEELGGVKKNMAGMRQAVKKFNQRMEEILGKDIYTEGGTPTTVGKARLQAAKDVRKGMNDFIQNTLNESGAAKALKFNNPTEAKALIERAKNFDNPEQFIEAMKTEGSASTAESKFASKTGTPNEGTDASTVGNAGLNVNERGGTATAGGGTHGKGYSTTPDQDLEEIWHMAHTDISSTKGDVFKASLKNEAQLLSAADEIKYRTAGQYGESAVTRLLNSKKGTAARRALELLGLNIGAAGLITFGAYEAGSHK